MQALARILLATVAVATTAGLITHGQVREGLLVALAASLLLFLSYIGSEGDNAMAKADLPFVYNLGDEVVHTSHWGRPDGLTYVMTVTNRSYEEVMGGGCTIRYGVRQVFLDRPGVVANLAVNTVWLFEDELVLADVVQKDQGQAEVSG